MLRTLSTHLARAALASSGPSCSAAGEALVGTATRALAAVATGWAQRAASSAPSCSSRSRQAAAGPSFASAHSSTLQRGFTTGSGPALHGGGGEPTGETIEVTFINMRDGSETTVRAAVGEHLLEAAHRNDVELEGACEGSLACSTCHVVLEQDVYDGLEEPCEDEMDMLDLAFGLTETSRLGCQVIATKELDGLRAIIPSATRNFAVDGFVPKPH